MTTSGFLLALEPMGATSDGRKCGPRATRRDGDAGTRPVRAAAPGGAEAIDWGVKSASGRVR